jgi:hypothetical protein
MCVYTPANCGVDTLADLGRNEPARWYKFFNETVYFVTAGLGAKNPGPELEQAHNIWPCL